MRSKYMVGLLLLGVCLLPNWASSPKTQGHYTSQRVDNLPSFHALSVRGNVEVEFMQLPTSAVYASGPQKILDQSLVQVKDGVLEVAYPPGVLAKKTDVLKVMITGPSLRRVDVSDKAEVHVRGKLREQEMAITLTQQADFSADDVAVHTLHLHVENQAEADINRLDAYQILAESSGQAAIELAGLALKAHFENHGSGEIDAADLRVQTGHAVVNGRGNIDISAYESLTATVFGKGRIKYRGSPVQMQRVGNLKHIIQDKDD